MITESTWHETENTSGKLKETIRVPRVLHKALKTAPEDISHIYEAALRAFFQAPYQQVELFLFDCHNQNYALDPKVDLKISRTVLYIMRFCHSHFRTNPSKNAKYEAALRFFWSLPVEVQKEKIVASQQLLTENALLFKEKMLLVKQRQKARQVV